MALPRIGVFIAFLDDSYQRTLWSHLQEHARLYGVDIVGFCGHGLDAPGRSQATMNLAYRLAGPRNLNGLIAFSNTLGTFHGGDAVQRLLENIKVPAVSLGFELDGFPSVSARGGPALATVVRHLIRDHGRRLFAIAAGPEDHSESREREDAVLQTLAAEGLTFDARLLFRGNFYTESGREAVAAFLASGVPFDAVICLNDHMAVGALHALRTHGFVLPTEVSLTGFDDVEEADWVSPPLSTVRQPHEALAIHALDLARALAAGRPAASRVLDCEPVLRRSCGCPPVPHTAGSASETDPETENLGRAAAESPEAVLRLLGDALSEHWGDLKRLHSWRRRILSVQAQSSVWADQALAWLAEEELRWERETRLHRDESEALVREHSVRLLGMLSLESIVRYIEDHFPSLGIPRSYFVLFDDAAPPYHETPPRARWLTTLRAPQRHLVEVPFDTELLFPPDDGFRMDGQGWLVEPLVYQEEALGYLLLEYGTGTDFETLRETISTAVKGALLMRQVLRHQSTLALEVEARTRELQEAHHDLQDVAHRTMQAIGQDIHDDLCQHLVGISMLTAVAEERLNATGSVEPGALSEIRELLDQAVQRSRQFARTLYPPGLEQHGFLSAVEDLIDSVRTPRASIQFSVEGDCSVADPERALQLYRIIQESLSNALRHSGSDVVLVRMERLSGDLLVEVRDFGRGLTPGAVGSGMGTRILQARAATLGAQLRIYQLDPGVCVSCRLRAS